MELGLPKKLCLYSEASRRGSISWRRDCNGVQMRNRDEILNLINTSKDQVYSILVEQAI